MDGGNGPSNLLLSKCLDLTMIQERKKRGVKDHVIVQNSRNAGNKKECEMMIYRDTYKVSNSFKPLKSGIFPESLFPPSQL